MVPGEGSGLALQISWSGYYSPAGWSIRRTHASKMLAHRRNGINEYVKPDKTSTVDMNRPGLFMPSVSGVKGNPFFRHMSLLMMMRLASMFQTHLDGSIH